MSTRFLDTNILLYAYDLDAPAKRAIARRLVEEAWADLGDTAISVQVLGEFHVNLRRRGIAQPDAARIVRDFAAWPVIPNTLDLLLAALQEEARWQISYWDALILAAARAAGARELLTEDLNHGQDYAGVHAINPFRDEES